MGRARRGRRAKHEGDELAERRCFALRSKQKALGGESTECCGFIASEMGMLWPEMAGSVDLADVHINFWPSAAGWGLVVLDLEILWPNCPISPNPVDARVPSKISIATNDFKHIQSNIHLC